MRAPTTPLDETSAPAFQLPDFAERHLLAIAGMEERDIVHLLDRADGYVERMRAGERHFRRLTGRTQVNLFFEPSTRTQSSFEIAGQRLGADVVNMSVAHSSVSKGETLLDTAMTLNAMLPDVLVVRHGAAGAAALLAQKVECAVVNAGDGTHEHPTQALLDALAIRRAKGRVQGLRVAICGDVLHSRVARSNIALLNTLNASVRVVAPATLLPSDVTSLGLEIFSDMDEGLEGCDVVMMLRMQNERMDGAYVPSVREYARFYALSETRLARAKPDATVMHPGPMNRGVEITSRVADGPRSLVATQVEMGVAVRMAVMQALLEARAA